MNEHEFKALRHIVRNGDDRNLSNKKWREIKIALYRYGFLQRRIGDWSWEATDDGKKRSMK